MVNDFVLNVREMEERDVELLANYWLNSNREHLLKMGVDPEKLPKKDRFIKNVTNQINKPLKEKKSYALIWECNEKQIGDSNVNEIIFGKQATMHMHIWNSDQRKKGIGTELVKKSLPFYFRDLKIDLLLCEPNSLNQAPNMILQKVGFKFVKKYKTLAGSLIFEQEVNRWEMNNDYFFENALQY